MDRSTVRNNPALLDRVAIARSGLCMLHCLALPLLLCLPALAGPKVPKSVTVGGKKCVLNGTGMREATVFKVDVYKGALYLPSKQRS